ncbi:sigma-70 family RNA polymerase sigma factor [Amycolatopsis sp. Hca4]|uniref:sigma-70 family RNA polymerase sigma factor n=1 Tax=Amycolatopsis sp. Hca4 TaxID=2742131 RepID=UPI0015923A98|nr:sigma-70 family RNA polymerase sigma factor [Amycolatopsis sp. Hca4]QKV80722.1 sigma-70 family RNA polymerase sigma factor [Amycolatopsis sp. Hca4]
MFDTARAAFAWLVTGPHPVALDGRQVRGLPPRLVSLDEVVRLTVAKGCPQQTRDAVWTALVTRSRTEGGTWTVACVGLALPVLLPVAAKLTNRFRGEVHDIHAAVLTGFLEALVDVDLTRPAILVRLRWAAYRAGHRALREALDAAAPVADLGTRAPGPEHADGHPDFVLLAAVDAGVLTATDAALIGDTRFGELSLAEAAQARGQTYKATQQARHRAERKLADYLSPSSKSDSGTRRQRRRNFAEAPEKTRRPVSPRPAKSGVGERGTRVFARPRPSRSTSEPGAVQEASSCD